MLQKKQFWNEKSDYILMRCFDMQYLVTAQEMKKCDRNTIKCFGMDSMVLMERAALAAAARVYE